MGFPKYETYLVGRHQAADAIPMPLDIRMRKLLFVQPRQRYPKQQDTAWARVITDGVALEDCVIESRCIPFSVVP